MEIKRRTVQLGAEGEQPRGSWKFRLAFFLVKLVVVGGAVTVGTMAVARGLPVLWDEATLFAAAARASVMERLTVTKVVTEYREVDEATLSQAIERVAKERGIDPLVMTVIAEKESSGGRALYRFEPGKFEQLRGSKKYKGRSTDELRMVASSHGVFHTMGYSAEHYCGLHWSRLYDTLTGARCTGEILSRLYADTAHVKDPSAQVREVLRRYNGEGELAEQYADHAMSLLAAILYKRVTHPTRK